MYSGKGVNDLRKYLAELLAHVHAVEADNDTDYDEDDDQRFANGMSAAEMYVEQQRERDRARGRGRRERERGRFRYMEDHIGAIAPLPTRQATFEARGIVRPATIESNDIVIAPEEVFEEEARTPLSRFSSSLLASLPLGNNVTLRRGAGAANGPMQQPEAGPSTGVFVEETKASSLATTPSPTEQHTSMRVANGAIPSEDARPSPPRNFADTPIVESSASTPAVEYPQRFHTAFFHYPTYGTGFLHDNARRGGENGRPNDASSSPGPSTSAATGPLRTFTPPEPLASSMNGRPHLYTPDFVLSTLDNRRPPMSRSISDTGYAADGSSTPGVNDLPFNGHWQDPDLEMGQSSDSVPLQYPYRYYQRPPDDAPTTWPPQSLLEAHGQRERRRQKELSRSKRRQHGAESPIPYLSSSPTTKELQESVHSAFANGSGTGHGASLTTTEEPSAGLGSSRLSPGVVTPAEASVASGVATAADSSRGRSVRRSWKSTFTAAENYASALFFGRGGATGSGNVSSASSSSGREGGRAS